MFLKIVLSTILINFCKSNLLFFDEKNNFPKVEDFDVESCGTRSTGFHPARSARIIGGETPPYLAYPWQAEIQLFSFKTERFEHHCGGTVVADKIIMTAAHCMQVSRQEHFRLILGDHSLKVRDLHEHSFRIDQLILHPEFRKDGIYSNDIALIKIKTTTVTTSHHIRPICLPNSDQQPTEGSWCSVTGWGLQEPNNKNSLSSTLQAAAVQIFNLKKCLANTDARGRPQKILNSMLCAGVLKGGVDACGGDSGGPLACEFDGRFVLMGIVSWGHGCAEKNHPGVYTSVEAFIDWIRETINYLED